MAAALTPLNANQEAYLASFAGHGDPVREAALERFAALGFPTTKNEDWKYTNLAPFLKTPYVKAAPVAPRLSKLPQGVRGGSLRAPAGIASFEKNALVALNTAHWDGGVTIEIPDGTVVEEPIEIVYTAPGGTQVVYPRTLIVAGRDSQARIVERYVGESVSFTCAVTELLAAEGANIEHYKLQSESAAALHYGHLAARQQRSSRLVAFNLVLGGGMVRNEVFSKLDGEGAECVLNGLYVTAGKQHVDNYTTLHHAQPHTTSHELYKGVLDGKSAAVFHGRIIVDPVAQKTDAIQRNRNLLLSKDAVINTKPQLEIYADDVRCTHGATVGQVDEDAVFYLRSRGIALEQARSLLTFAFASEIIGRIGVESLRRELADSLFRRLAG